VTESISGSLIAAGAFYLITSRHACVSVLDDIDHRSLRWAWQPAALTARRESGATLVLYRVA